MPVPNRIKKTFPGAHGLGKVNVVYKAKKPKNRCLVFISLLFYPVFFSFMFVSFAWSRPVLRYEVLIPTFHRIFAMIDEVKFLLSPAQKGTHVSANGFTIISKPTLHEALFEQGYLHASDRLFQMEMYRRLSMGRLSEVLGSRTVYLDTYARTFNFYEAAETDYAKLDGTSKDLLRRYVDGVNAYISKESNFSLPLEFDFTYSPLLRFTTRTSPTPATHNIYTIEPWLPQHSLAVARVWLYLHTEGWEEGVVELATSLLDKQLNLNFTKLMASARDALDILTGSDTNTELPKLGRVGTSAGVVVARRKDGAAAELALTSYSHSYLQGFYYKTCLYWGGDKEEGGGGCGVSIPSLPFLMHGRSSRMAFSLLSSVTPSTADTLHQGPHASSDATAGLSVVTREEVIGIYPSIHTSPLDLQSVDIQEVRSSSASSSRAEYVDIFPLLSSVVRRILKQGGIGEKGIYLHSPFLSSPLDIVGGLHRLLTAQTPAALREAPWTLGEGHVCVYATKDMGVGVISSPKPSSTKQASLPLLTHLLSKTTTQDREVYLDAQYDTVLGGPATLLTPLVTLPPALCRLSTLCSYLHGEAGVEDVGGDVFSPSSLYLSQLLHTALQGALTAGGGVGEGKYKATLPPLLQALSRYEGHLRADTVVGSIVEGVRVYLLTHPHRLLHASLGGGQHTNYFNTMYASLLLPNATALSHIPDIGYRTLGLQAVLKELSASPHLNDLLVNATIHTLDWLTERFPPSPLPVLPPLSSGTPKVEDGLQDKAAWRWGEVGGVFHAHVMEPAGKLQNAVLGRGPDQGVGALDSVHRHMSSGSPSGAALLFRDDLHAKHHDAKVAFRMVVDMAQDDLEAMQVTGLYLESGHSHAKFKSCIHMIESLVWDAVRKTLDLVTGTQVFPSNISSKSEL